MADPNFKPADLVAASATSDQWFAASATLPAFVLRSIFRQLIADDWHRGVATADWQQFLNDVAPRIIAVADAVPTGAMSELNSLVVAYHSTI